MADSFENEDEIIPERAKKDETEVKSSFVDVENAKIQNTNLEQS